MYLTIETKTMFLILRKLKSDALLLLKAIKMYEHDLFVNVGYNYGEIMI